MEAESSFQIPCCDGFAVYVSFPPWSPSEFHSHSVRCYNIVLSKEAEDGGGIPEYHTEEFLPEPTVCRIACVVCPMKRED